MRSLDRIGIGLLVGLCFASGYAARMRANAAERTANATRHDRMFVPGTRYAAANLDGAGKVDFMPLQTLGFVVNSLRQYFVEQITDEAEGKMAHDALKGMLAKLDDPNSRFLDIEQRKIVMAASEGTFHGIGAILGIKRIKTGEITEEHLIVVSPLQSGPAAQAGLRPGDDITAIGGKSVLSFNPFQKANQLAKTEQNRKVWSADLKKHMEAEKKRIENGIPIMEAENKLMTEDKAELELTVVRKGAPASLKISVTPKEFKVEPVTSSVIEDGKLGYLKINCLTADADTGVSDALSQFQSANVNGLVIDLRGAVGGEIAPMLDVASHFAGGKKLATLLKSHGRKSDVTAPKDDSNSPWNKPITVLVNRGTARMAEVLAVGLKEVCGAKLVGEKTYGDLSHVTLIEEADGSAITFTSGVFLAKTGANYNTKGVPVDVQAASSAAGDPQLKEAIKLLTAPDRRS